MRCWVMGSRSRLKRSEPAHLGVERALGRLVMETALRGTPGQEDCCSLVCSWSLRFSKLGVSTKSQPTAAGSDRAEDAASQVQV